MVFTRKFLLLGLLFLSRPAWCDSLFVEPSIAFETGSASYTSTSVAPSRSIHFSGTSVGLRFGARVSSLWLGIEPVLGQGNMNTTNSDGTSGSGSYSQTSVFGLVGYDFQDWLRMWAGTTVYDMRKENYSSVENATVTGNAYKLGALIKPFKQFGFGLEYDIENPTKFSDNLLGEVSFSKTSWDRITVILAVFF